MQRSELCSEKEFLYKFSQHIVALENRKSIRATIFSRLRSLSIDNSFALKYMKSEELGHDLGHFLGTGIFNHLKSSLHSKPSIREKYGHIETHLGQGTNGTVLLSQKINGDKQHLFAIKEFRKKHTENEKDYIKKVTSEFCISSSLHHQNVIETVDLIRNDKSQLCEVMEYCPGGDLCSLILNSVLSLDESNCFFAQLINGVAYIHSMGVAHKVFLD